MRVACVAQVAEVAIAITQGRVLGVRERSHADISVDELSSRIENLVPLKHSSSAEEDMSPYILLASSRHSGSIYEAPIRIAQERGAGSEYPDGVYHACDTKRSVKKRIERLDTGYSGAEDPAQTGEDTREVVGPEPVLDPDVTLDVVAPARPGH
jgi:hypothetical protein